MNLLPEVSTDEIMFVFPCRKRGDGHEIWSRRSMLHVDAMTTSSFAPTAASVERNLVRSSCSTERKQ